MQKLNTSTKDIYKKLEQQNLITEFEDELVLTLLSGASKYSINRTGMRLLVEFENTYVDTLEKYLLKENNISLVKLKQGNNEQIKKIDDLKNDLFTNLLLSFESTFSYIKHWLSINTLDKLNVLRNTLLINIKPLRDRNISRDDLINLLTEIPYYLDRDFKNYGLVYEFGKNTTLTIEHNYKDDLNSEFIYQKTLYKKSTRYFEIK